MNVAMCWSNILVESESAHPDAMSFERILRTTELLEQVLMHLPPIDLLRIQNLCYTTRDLVKTSPMLQTKLYLRAANFKNSERYVIDAESKTMLGGAYAQRHMANAMALRLTVKTVEPIAINPLIVREIPGNPNTLRKLLDGGFGSAFFAIVPNKLNAKLEHASCLDMFLTQPPVTSLLYQMHPPVCDTNHELWDWHSESVRDWLFPAMDIISNDVGLRLRDVLEAAKYQTGGIESIPFDDVVFTAQVLESMDIRGWVGVDDGYD